MKTMHIMEYLLKIEYLWIVVQFKIIFLILNENIGYDHSLKPSHWDGSNKGSQGMCLWKNKENYP